MKILKPLAALFLLVISECSFAQENHRHGFGIHQSFYDYNAQLIDGKAFALDSALSHNVRLSYQNRLNPTWELRVGLSNGFTLNQALKDVYLDKAYTLGLDLGIMMRLDNGRILKQNSRIAPYFHFAYRMDYVNKLKTFQLNPILPYNQYGAGLLLRVGDRSQIQLHISLDQQLGGSFNTLMHYGLGFTQSLGKVSTRQATPENKSENSKDVISSDQYKQMKDSLLTELLIKTDSLRYWRDSLNNLVLNSDAGSIDPLLISSLRDSLAKCKSSRDTVTIVKSVTTTPGDDPKLDPPVDTDVDADPVKISTDTVGYKYYVVALSTKKKREAVQLQEILLNNFEYVEVFKQSNGYYRVGVLAGKDLDLAMELLKEVKRLGYDPVWISKQ
ncbi:hypothetical protein GYB22_10370 [bacterium]|nr:hypothetical protein [bacterium]